MVTSYDMEREMNRRKAETARLAAEYHHTPREGSRRSLLDQLVDFLRRWPRGSAGSSGRYAGSGPNGTLAGIG